MHKLKRFSTKKLKYLVCFINYLYLDTPRSRSTIGLGITLNISKPCQWSWLVIGLRCASEFELGGLGCDHNRNDQVNRISHTLGTQKGHLFEAIISLWKGGLWVRLLQKHQLVVVLLSLSSFFTIQMYLAVYVTYKKISGTVYPCPWIVPISLQNGA